MQINISLGEVLDRLSILEIKEQRIVSPTKLEKIRAEKSEYTTVLDLKRRHTVLYSLLMYVNTEIWDLTEQIKKLEPSDVSYAMLAHSIFELNQQRFRLKMGINCVTHASIQEQKSYAESSISLLSSDPVDIAYCFLQYDHVTVESYYPHPICAQLGITVKIPSTDSSASIPRTTPSYSSIATIISPLFPPISYISGGLLGDFIHQLSIVCENFCVHGKQGILYISNSVGDNFRYGLERAYTDLLPIVSAQPYIKEFKIHNNEQYDIDLSAWRTQGYLYRENWFTMFQRIYSVPFASHPWLACGPVDTRFSDKVVVSTSSQRFSGRYDGLDKRINASDAMFVTLDPSLHTFFINKTGIHIPMYVCSSLDEMVAIIRGSKLFIGNLSAPLAFAYALHKKSCVLLQNGQDDRHLDNLPNHLPFLELLH
jgi:hypothetical protein